MARIRVNVLGPVELQVDGRIAALSPRALRTLMRLVIADGQPVGVKQLRWDLWQEVDAPRQARNGRNQVQKGVSELRAALDPDRTGTVLRTERRLNAREVEYTYRLDLDAERLDTTEFDTLLSAALHGPAAAAADQLTRAVALWRGTPFAEAGDDEYATARRDELRRRYRTALHELARIHGRLERFDLMLAVAERMAAEFPGDPDAEAELDTARRRLRELHGARILHCDFPALRTSVVVIRGDLFAQDDANLLVGFTDTFDVETKQDMVINRASTQGQLVERLYGGDTAALDRELRRGLHAVAPASRETTQAKPRGKRIRYPIGTVVAIPLGGRRVFATAYSCLGNDLVARSSPEHLATALDEVWASAAQFGQLAPIAVPLIGSGLSRLTELGPEDVVIMIVESFLRGCRTHRTVATQLRIVLRPCDLERMDMARVAKAVAAMGERASI
ncbi:DUF6430 domain-containing protein [Kibdelosporangium lantanae]